VWLFKVSTVFSSAGQIERSGNLDKRLMSTGCDDIGHVPDASAPPDVFEPNEEPLILNVGDRNNRALCERCQSRWKCPRLDEDRRRARRHQCTTRWVGLGVIANNLMSTATFLNARATM
jgi:hypothetical protein